MSESKKPADRDEVFVDAGAVAEINVREIGDAVARVKDEA